jgi:hypothetical protein
MTLQFGSIGLAQTGCCKAGKDWFQPVSTGLFPVAGCHLNQATATGPDPKLMQLQPVVQLQIGPVLVQSWSFFGP